jgi:hypothetical protein
MSTPYEIRLPSLRKRLMAITGITEETVDAVLETLNPELAAHAEYENAVNWMTECTSCARLLDSCYAETIRAEQAEAKLAALTAKSLDQK